MTEKESINYLNGIPRPGPKKDRSRMDSFLRFCGNPQKGQHFIHVAGTNGKGSTCRMLAAAFHACGYKTGLFTSPHIRNFRERMMIDGKMISREDFIRQVERIRLDVENYTGEKPIEFEMVTIMAFRYFQEQQCDIVILETGLGGLLDSTNVIDTPEVSVITPVDYDHMAILGKTIAEIAAQKAGIIKPNGNVVIAGAQRPTSLKVFRKTAKAEKADLYLAEKPQEVVLSEEGTAFKVREESYQIRLLGEHQAENACTVLKTLEICRRNGWNLPEKKVKRAIEHVSPLGRLEIVGKSPLRIIDGGHNPQAIEAACKTLQSIRKGKLYTLFGMMADKNIHLCIEKLASVSDAFICVSSGNARASDPEELVKNAKRFCKNVYAEASLKEAALHLAEVVSEGDTVFLSGSFYLLDEGKRVLREINPLGKSNS